MYLLEKIRKNGSRLKAAETALLLLAAGLIVYQIVYFSGSDKFFPGNHFINGGLSRFSGAGRGLIYGIYSGYITWSMPLPGFIAALLDNYPKLLELLPRAGMITVLLLIYSYGALRGGRLSGAIYIATAALFDFKYTINNAEQIFLALTMLLYLNINLLREKRPGRLFDFMSGLSLGFSLLTRSTLLLFPFAASALMYLRSGLKPKKALAGAALALIGAYALILPWMGVNKFVSGSFNPGEYERSTCNIITGVLGTVYTIEGDARALAGLGKNDSVLKWAVREVAADPGGYFVSVLRRIWHLSFMFPVAFALAFAALLLRRGREDPFLLALAAYFIFIHCLFSIEERYFYPLRYLLAMIIAGAAASFAGRTSPAHRRTQMIPMTVFFVFGLLTLALEALLLAYPLRAKEGDQAGSLNAPLAAEAGNIKLLKHRSELLIYNGKTEEGVKLLKAYLVKAKGGDEEAAYLLYILEAAPPLKDPPSGPLGGLDLRVFKLLRQLELGLKREAVKELPGILEGWEQANNMIRGTPYDRDREVLSKIRAAKDSFANKAIPGPLLYWPVQRRGLILERLGEMLPLSPGLELTRFLSINIASKADLPAFKKAAGTLSFLELADEDEARKAAARQLSLAAHYAGLPAAGALPAPLPALLAAFGSMPAGQGEFMESFEKNKVESAELSELSSCWLGKCAPETARRLYARRPDNHAYLALSLKTLNRENYTAAIAALEQDPRLVLAAAQRELAAGRISRAVGLADWAVGRGRGAGEIFHRAALVYQGAGRLEKALSALNQAAAAGAAVPKLFSDRGVVLLLLKRSAEAEADFRQALAADPSLADASLSLAYVLAARGDLAGAEKIYEVLLLRTDLNVRIRASAAAGKKSLARSPVN